MEENNYHVTFVLGAELKVTASSSHDALQIATNAITEVMNKRHVRIFDVQIKTDEELAEEQLQQAQQYQEFEDNVRQMQEQQAQSQKDAEFNMMDERYREHDDNNNNNDGGELLS